MVCINTCMVALVLLCGNIATMITAKTSSNFKRFDAVLDEKQKKIYHQITMERLRIYIEGMILGLVCGLLSWLNAPKKMDKTSRLCIFVVIVLVVNMFYYKLYPKSTYMVKHLNTVEQKEAWIGMYTEMKNRHILGMLLGFVGYGVLAHGLS